MKSKGFDRLMQRIEGSFTVALIAQPLEIFPCGITSEQVNRVARDNRYSQVVYRSREHGCNERLNVQEFNSRANYQPVGDPRIVTHEDLLAEGTPLPETIDLLVQRPFYLVLSRNRIEQLITQSDLNHLPVRTYLFALLAHVEALLAEWVVQQHPGTRFLEKLSPKAQEDVKGLHQAKIQQDIDTQLIDCTTLTHKLVVIEKTEAMWKGLGYSTKRNYMDAKTQFNRLRGRLQHGMTPLPASTTAAGSATPDSEASQDDTDAIRDAIAHNGELVWDPDSTRWLADCVRQIREWIPKITKVLAEPGAAADGGGDAGF